jgi:predicted O-methyltransferase YrrM
VSVAGLLAARVPPDAAIVSAAHRGVLAAAAPRLVGHRDPSSRALARALRSTAVGRLSGAERTWIARIEQRRKRIVATGDNGLGTACPYWSIPRIWGRFLMRLVRELRPASCIEMGSGFGISGAYQAAALELNGSGELLALDQEPSLASIATRTWAALGLERRITLELGPIGRTLEGAASRAAPVHYAFIDAEHTEQATVRNFEMLLPHLAPGAVVVVDDIKVDQGMDRAWTRIAEQDAVSAAVGLRRVGVVVVDAS